MSKTFIPPPSNEEVDENFGHKNVCFQTERFLKIHFAFKARKKQIKMSKRSKTRSLPALWRPLIKRFAVEKCFLLKVDRQTEFRQDRQFVRKTMLTPANANYAEAIKKNIDTDLYGCINAIILKIGNYHLFSNHKNAIGWILFLWAVWLSWHRGNHMEHNILKIFQIGILVDEVMAVRWFKRYITWLLNHFWKR